MLTERLLVRRGKGRAPQGAAAVAAHRITRTANFVATCCAIVAAGLLVSIVFLLAADVFTRNFFDHPFKGTVPRVEILLVSFGALCLAPAERVGNHVTMQLVVDKLPHRIRKAFDIGVYVLVIGLLLWMTYATATAALDSFQRGETRVGIIEISTWPARALIAVGLAALVVCFIDRFMKRLVVSSEER